MAIEYKVVEGKTNYGNVKWIILERESFFWDKLWLPWSPRSFFGSPDYYDSAELAQRKIDRLIEASKPIEKIVSFAK